MANTYTSLVDLQYERRQQQEQRRQTILQGMQPL
jgi:hypothetical protein